MTDRILVPVANGKVLALTLESYQEALKLGAELIPYEQHNTPQTSFKTTKACVLMALSRHDFLGLLRQNPDVSMQVIQELSRRLRDADEQIRALLFERVEGRTRQLLVRMAREPVADRPDRLATPAITHQQLADLVGTSRETVTRVIKELKQEGWLEQVGKQYLVAAADEPAS